MSGDLTGDTLHTRTRSYDRAALVAYVLAHPHGDQEVAEALGLVDGPDPDMRCPVCGARRELDRTRCRSTACKSRKVHS